MEYGVQVDNKFAFASDDEVEDPSDLIKLAAVEKKTPAQKKAEKDEAKRAKAKAEADRKAAALQAAVAAAGKEQRPAQAGRGGPRGGRGGPRGAGGPRPPRTSDGEARPPRSFDNEGRPPRSFDGPREGGEFRGRGRGRGGPRPFRGGRGGSFNNAAPSAEGEHEVAPTSGDEHVREGDENTPPAFQGERPRRGGFRGGRGGGFRGGRQFDRQSGSDRTGIRAQEKKEGHGKGNWGTEQDELVGETEEVKVSGDETETPVAPREKTAEELEQEALEAELAKQKTLAEYRATIQKDDSKFNTRKAGEGNEENFGKLVPMAKKQIVDDDTHEVVVVKSETKKKVIDINIRFADPSRGERTERGGRGGPRGGRGGRGSGFGGHRGGNVGQRAPRQAASHFNAADSEFPALGAH